MATDTIAQTRKQILELVRGGHAHAGFDSLVEAFSKEDRGRRPAGAPHTAWQLLEHMRLAQWDILEFSRDPEHQSPKFPEGYWPKTEAPPSADAWDRSVEAFKKDARAFEKLLEDPAAGLFQPFAHGEGQNLFREALTLADHNSYHLGQLAYLLKQLGGEPR